MDPFEEFRQTHAQECCRLSNEGRNALQAICEGTGHLRPRTAIAFYKQVLEALVQADDRRISRIIFAGATALSRINWAMVRSYFTAIDTLPDDEEVLIRWYRMAIELARADVDVGIAFLEHSPAAFRQFGEMTVLFQWGRQAAEALSARDRGVQLWPSVRAYLSEAAAARCAFPLDRWRFFLSQAHHIAARSSEAAVAFIQLGNHACLLLDDEETSRWVKAGLEDCQTDEQLLNYFSATSQNALAKRDDIATGEALKDHSNTLALICEAMAGHPVRLRSNKNLFGQPGFSGGPANDGRTVFLPEVVPTFGLFKLMALHQVTLMQTALPAVKANPLALRSAHADFSQLHIQADRHLIEKLPGLKSEMLSHAAQALPKGYPAIQSRRWTAALPWWGDIMPSLTQETAMTIQALTEKAEARFNDLPPELIETLLSSLMAEGPRDKDALWELLAEMMDSLEFVSPEAQELPENVKTFYYKEWDCNLSDYKLDWCLVRQRLPKDDPHPFVSDLREQRQGLIKLIRRQFTRLKPERLRKYRAQPYGDGLDIDALIQAVVDKRCGSILSEDVYIRRDKRIRDVAVLFLMDLSGSTEEIVNGRRVIDIQKEALILMAEALDALEDPFAIYGFSSEGRFRVDLFNIKDFGEPYSDSVQYRLGNLAPIGLTRMGTAVRHATAKLEVMTAAIKLLVILTDGRPYDLEYGTLDYAEADTHKAIQETRHKRIHPFIITTDKKSVSYIKRIAPQTQSIIVPKVELLPTLLPALYKRLTT
jgi:hypothetical protein